MGLFDFIKKAQQESQQKKKHDESLRSLGVLCEKLNGHLKVRNIVNFYYSFDESVVESGDAAVEAEKRAMESIQQKADRYISIGGAPELFVGKTEEDADNLLKRVEFLFSNGALTRQLEWKDKSIYEIKEIMQREEEDFKKLNTLVEQLNSYSSSPININNLTGIEFEFLCQRLLTQMGYETQTTKQSGDGGIDIIATNNLPLMGGKYIIQCKRYSGNVGQPILRDLYGVVMSENANKGILITTSGFTNSAISFAEGKQLELIDGRYLYQLLSAYGVLKESVEEKEIPAPLSYMNDYERQEFLQIQAINGADSKRSIFLSIKFLYEYIDDKYTSRPDSERQWDLNLLPDIAEFGELYCKPVIALGVSIHDKTANYRYYMTLLAEARFAFVKGDFYKAYSNYKRVLEEYSVNWIEESFARINLLVAAISICNIVGAIEERDNLYGKYHQIYEEHLHYLSNNSSTGSTFLFFERVYEAIKDYKTALMIYFFLPENVYEDADKYIGIDSIGGGQLKLIIDEETNSLKTVSMQPFYKNGIEQQRESSTIIEDLSTKVAMQKKYFSDGST